MQGPSAFDLSRAIGTNISGAFREAKDQSAIDQILSQAVQSGDPMVLQDSIGKILSQVSPERQGAAVQFLENRYKAIQGQKQQQQQNAALQKEGINPNLPANLQAEQFKEKSKQLRMSQYGLGQNQQPPQQVTQINQSEDQTTRQPQGSVFSKLTDDQLVVASGAQDKEISEPAKNELKRRSDERVLEQKKSESTRKYHTDISQDIIKENEKSAQNIIQSESSLSLMEDAIAGKDLSFFSPDNIAEITGIEGFRSKEGAIFKTAGKEFFIGTLKDSGARPNQFIEKQIVDMLPKIGRSAAANLSVVRAFRNEIDLKKEKIRLTRDLANDLEAKLGYVPRNIGQIRDEKLREYAEKKQKELNNDLRAYKSIEEKSKETFMKVEPGTPISKVVAQSLLRQFGNDPKKAREEAKKLGYSF